MCLYLHHVSNGYQIAHTAFPEWQKEEASILAVQVVKARNTCHPTANCRVLPLAPSGPQTKTAPMPCSKHTNSPNIEALISSTGFCREIMRIRQRFIRPDQVESHPHSTNHRGRVESLLSLKPAWLIVILGVLFQYYNRIPKE